jgi:sigma-54-specific transcriptional regulator
LQVKLLRVLQERQVVRLGSRKPIPINVRLIAATNVKLEPAVREGRFRGDLYYRLNVAAVDLPPLRERRADILPLADYFAEMYRCELRLERISFTPNAQRALLAHSWPGNIRELENVVHYGLIMCEGSVLEAGDLRLAEGMTSRESLAAADFPSPVNQSEEGALSALRDDLSRLLESDRTGVFQSVERLLVKTAFEHCDRNQVRTAKRLGLSRNVVRTQLMRHGLLPVSLR